MSLLGCLGVYKGSGYSSFSTRASDWANNINTNSYIDKGLMVLTPFLYNVDVNTRTNTSQEMKTLIENVLSYGNSNNLPVEVKFESDWEGTPKYVDDGAGSTYGSVKYQQIPYSASDVTFDNDIAALYSGNQQLKDYFYNTYANPDGLAAHFGNSVSTWGGCPWLSFNNTSYKTFVSGEYDKALTEFSTVRDRKRSDASNRVFDKSIAVSHETLYFADGINADPQNRTNLMGDFSPGAVTDSGFTLNPRNGLTWDNRMWLHTNAANYVQFLVDNIYGKIKRERIIASGGSTTYPTSMLKHEIRTEPYGYPAYPIRQHNNNYLYPYMEIGITNKSVPGAEWFHTDYYKWLLKQREFGIIANPNVEVTGIGATGYAGVNDPTGFGPALQGVLLLGYAMGARYFTFYNWAATSDIQTQFTSNVNLFVNSLPEYASQIYNKDTNNIGASADGTGQTFKVAENGMFINKVKFRVIKVGTVDNLRLRVSLYDAPSKTNLVAFKDISPDKLPTNYNWAEIMFNDLVQLTPNTTYYMEFTEYVAYGTRSPGSYFGLLINTANDYPYGNLYIGGVSYPAYCMSFTVGAELTRERKRSQLIGWRRHAADVYNRVSTEVQPGDAYSLPEITNASNDLSNSYFKDAYEHAIKADVLRYPVPYIAKGTTATALSPFPVSINPGNTSKYIEADVTSYTSGDSLYFDLRANETGNVTISHTMTGKDIYIQPPGGSYTYVGSSSVTYNITSADSTYKVKINSGATPTPGPTSTPTPTPTSTPTPDLSIKGDWHLNESSGTTAADSSGNSNTGTLINGPTWTAGRSGNAVNLDGVDDYVNIPDSSTLDGMSTLTLSMWIKLTQMPGTKSYIPLGKDTEGYGYSYRIAVNPSGTLHFNVQTTNNGWYTAGTGVDSTTVLTANTWYHVAATYDGSYVKIYVNGLPEGTGSQAISGSIYNSTSPLRLGYNCNAPAYVNYTNAVMDEVRVYNRALNATEVQNLYNSY